MSLMPMNRQSSVPSEGGILMQDISRQRKLAEELRRQGSEPLQGQMVSGHYVAPSWTQGLAKLLQTTVGAYQEGKADESEKDFASQKNKRFAEILNGNKEKQIEGAPTVTSTMPAYEPSQMDQFGSPLQGVERQPIETATPTFTQESPEQVQARQQQAILEYMQQYGNTPEAQVLLAQLNKQDDRAYARGEKLDDRTYTDTREEKLYNRGRTDKLSDIDAERKYQDIVRKETQGFQVSQQDRQFAQQYKLQSQSQGFQASQADKQRDFTAKENDKTRSAALTTAEAKAKNKGLSVAAQKEVFDAEDGIKGSKEAIKAFSKALELNDKAMGGFGAGALATAGSVLPEFARPGAVDATKELDNVLQGAALPNLKAIFGGMPTEGERAILLEVQGSSAQPAAVRKKIFERAIEAAENRIKFNTQKAKQLRDGTYFTESGGINMDEPSSGVTEVDW